MVILLLRRLFRLLLLVKETEEGTTSRSGHASRRVRRSVDAFKDAIIAVMDLHLTFVVLGRGRKMLSGCLMGFLAHGVT